MASFSLSCCLFILIWAILSALFITLSVAACKEHDHSAHCLSLQAFLCNVGRNLCDLEIFIICMPSKTLICMPKKTLCGQSQGFAASMSHSWIMVKVASFCLILLGLQKMLLWVVSCKQGVRFHSILKGNLFQ